MTDLEEKASNVVNEFACPTCDSKKLQWEARTAPETPLVCEQGHNTGKTVGELRTKLQEIGWFAVQRILSKG